MKCDFCSAAVENPVCIMSVAGQIDVVAGGPNGIFGESFSPDWAACPICSALINAGQFSDLLDRAAELNLGKSYESSLFECYKAMLASVWIRVFGKPMANQPLTRVC